MWLRQNIQKILLPHVFHLTGHHCYDVPRKRQKMCGKSIFGCFDALAFFYVGYKRPAKGASKGTRKKAHKAIG